MKTNSLLATLFLIVLSCTTKPELDNVQDGDMKYVPMTFTATADAPSKVLLKDDHVSLHWETLDMIKVFDGVSNDLPPFTSTGNGATVDFVGNVANESGPFYALYPYQGNATYADGSIYAEVPSVQTAVAGSVPSNAFIAAAKAGVDGSLRFRTVLGYIRFTLNDDRAADIESITLSGNNKEAIAGQIVITFDQQGIPTDTYVSGTMSRTVTLEGDFTDGADYIFAIREQVFSKGLTLSILYNDGTRRYISSDYRPVDGGGADIMSSANLVMNIGEIDASWMKTTMPQDRYAAYLHGYDLEIAGKIYNKYNVPDFELMRSEGIASTINQSTNRIIFIDSQTPENYPDHGENVAGPCKIYEDANVSGEQVLLVGRYSDRENLFEPHDIINAQSGSLILYDLDIDLLNCRNPFIQHKAASDSDIEALYVDKCKVKNLFRKFFTSNNRAKSVKNIRILNSDFELDKTTTYNVVRILDFSECEHINRIEEIIFNNNIVYHQYPDVQIASTCRVVDIASVDLANQYNYADRLWYTKVTFCNNTLYNVPAPHSFVKFYKVASLKMNRNICAVAPEYDAYSGYMSWLYAAHSDDVIDLENNVYYGLSTNNWYGIRDSAADWEPAAATVQKSNVDPFETIDYSTATFVPIAQYSEYGAQR